MPSLGFEEHNHGACVHDALADAESHCAEHGLRLTESRRRVLEILLEAHRAMGAYEILDRLRRKVSRPENDAALHRAGIQELVFPDFIQPIEGSQ